MKLAIVIVFLIIAVNVRADDDDSDEKKATPTFKHRISDTSSSSEKRWRPIFPKNARKFVVTMKPIQSYSTNVNRVRMKPIMSKVIPTESKISNKEYRQNAVTRRPLMKFAKFTVKPFTRSIISKTIRTSPLMFPRGKNYKGKEHGEKKENHTSEKVNEENSSEEKLSNYFRYNGSKRTTKSPTSNLNVMETRIETTNQYHTTTTNAPKVNRRPIQSYLSSEEEEDRKEFIFIPRTTKTSANAMPQSAESNEIITTEFSPRRPASRQKRSINVIEEENLGTTVSGFKFTGKPAALISDLVFKNINN